MIFMVKIFYPLEKNSLKAPIVLAIFFLLAVGAGEVSGATYSVCNAGCDYSSIQAALNAVSTGDTVNVSRGNYSENIIINKSITLLGSGDGMTHISPVDFMGSVIFVTGDGAHVEGFSISGANGGSLSSGIFFSGVENCVISNNILSGNMNGILLESSENNIISGNNLSRNTLGLWLDYSNNNKILNNNASNNGEHGIMTGFSSGSNLDGNIVNSNGAGGLVLDVSKDNIIRNNVIKENGLEDVSISVNSDDGCSDFWENNTGSGGRPLKYFNQSINLQDEVFSQLILCNADHSNLDKITVSGSDSKDNNGLYVIRTDNSTFTNITSTGNYNGFYVESSANNTIIKNTFKSNFNSGLSLASSKDNKIANNTVTENLGNDIYISPGVYPFCDNLILDNLGSGNLPIKYFNRSVQLSNQIISELILCNADNSNITNIEIRGSTGKNNNGLYLINTDNSRFSGITSSDNKFGLNLWASNNNKIIKSKFQSNDFGIKTFFSFQNYIYDNLINSTNNSFDSDGNYWNTTRVSGTNIVGGPTIGGNYWGLPFGDGFSDACDEFDYDGICDSRFVSPDGIVDYLPLTHYEESGNGPPITPPPGGGPNPPAQTEFRVFLQNITQNNTGVFNFSKVNSPIITYINVTVNKNMTLFTMYIKYFSSRPGEVEEVIGDVYRYFEIKPSTNINKSRIDNGTIRFRVSKQWLEDNNIPKGNVFMKRYNSTRTGVKWENLNIRFDVNATTGRVFESTEYIHYVVETSGFSYFVIGGTTYTPSGFIPITYPPSYTGGSGSNGVVSNGSDKTNGTIIVDTGNKTIDEPGDTYWYLNLPNIINCPDTNFLCNSTEFWFDGEYSRTAINQNLMFRFDLEPNVTTGRIWVEAEETKGDWGIFVNGKEMGKLGDGLTNTSVNIPKITSSVLYVSLTKAGEGNEIKLKRIHFDPNGGEPEPEEDERSDTGLAIAGVLSILVLGGSGLYYWKYVKK